MTEGVDYGITEFDNEEVMYVADVNGTDPLGVAAIVRKDHGYIVYSVVNASEDLEEAIGQAVEFLTFFKNSKEGMQ